MLAIHVPTRMCWVAPPISCAVAITSVFTSAAKIASNPASSASRATACTSAALHPTPGITPSPSRPAIASSFRQLGVLLGFSLPPALRARRLHGDCLSNSLTVEAAAIFAEITEAEATASNAVARQPDELIQRIDPSTLDAVHVIWACISILSRLFSQDTNPIASHDFLNVCCAKPTLLQAFVNGVHPSYVVQFRYRDVNRALVKAENSHLRDGIPPGKVVFHRFALIVLCADQGWLARKREIVRYANRVRTADLEHVTNLLKERFNSGHRITCQPRAHHKNSHHST